MLVRGIEKMKSGWAHALLAVAGLLLATVLHAAPHFGDMTFSASHDNDGTDTKVFAIDTPKIFLHADLEDAVDDTKVSSTWIAEKTDKAPPNYKIDSVELTASENMDVVTFSLSKPNAGWPVGDYRVDLFINGKPAGSAHFKVR
jgi:hypothetical protein